jgi:hypothetical protein
LKIIWRVSATKRKRVSTERQRISSERQRISIERERTRIHLSGKLFTRQVDLAPTREVLECKCLSPQNKFVFEKDLARERHRASENSIERKRTSKCVVRVIK